MPGRIMLNRSNKLGLSADAGKGRITLAQPQCWSPLSRPAGEGEGGEGLSA